MDIGEYVHYRWQNYKRFGLQRPSTDRGGSDVDVISAYQAQKSKIANLLGKDFGNLTNSNKTIIKESVEGLNTKLLLVRNWESGATNITSAQAKEAEEFVNQLKKDIEAQGKKGFETVLYDAGFGKATDTKVARANSSMGEKVGTSLRKLQQQWKILQENINSISYANFNEVERIISDKKGLENTYNLVIQQISEYISLKGTRGSSTRFAYSRLPNGATAKELVKKINQLNQEIGRILGGTGGDSNQYQGLAAELMVADAVRSVGKRVLKNAVEQTVGAIGSEAISRSGFNKQNVGRLMEQMLGNDSMKGNYSKKIEYGDYYATLKTTQDKVDVEAVYKDKNGEMLQPLKISVKNINASSPFEIHILRGSSVLQMLQDDGEFLNHYLNIVPIRQGENAGNALREEYHQVAKAMILARALTGSSFRISKNGGAPYNQQVNAFFILDNSRGSFVAYAMSDIINQISNNLQDLHTIETGDFDNALSSLKNTWVGGPRSPEAADSRIVNLLAQLHQMKLNVSLSKAFLNTVTPIAGSFM